MTDLSTRFQSLDDLATPNLWHEIEARAVATRPVGIRRLPWALIAVTVLLALAIAGAALIGSGIMKLPAPFEASPALPGPTHAASPEPSGPLGGGLLLVQAAYDKSNPGPLDVFTLDPETGQRTMLGTLPEGFADFQHRYTLQWGADREHVLITNYNGEGPKQLDDPTDAARQLTFVCCEPPREVLPDNGKGDGTSPSQPRAQQWVLSPESDRIAGLHYGQIRVAGFPLSTPDAIVILDLQSGKVRTLPLPAGTQGNDPISWSPDGSAVVVSGCRPCNNAGLITSNSGGIGDSGGDWSKLTPTAVEHAHLFIVPVDGSPAQELLDESESTFGSAAWSPSGTTIAFLRNVCPGNEHAPYCLDGTVQVVTMSVADSRETVVASTGGGGPVWSPDGRRIPFADATSVYVMDADGSHLVKLNNGQEPRWSPDGEWLLYSASDKAGTTTGLWIVPADGGKPRLLGTYGAWAW
jgi:hypothetical protein